MEQKGPLEKAPFVPKQQCVFLVSMKLETGLMPAVVPVRYTESMADAQRFAGELEGMFRKLVSHPAAKAVLRFLDVMGVSMVITEINRRSPLEVMPGNPLLVNKH